MAQNDRVYEDLKIFVTGSDGKKRPLVIGYFYQDGDKRRFQINAFPPPGAVTDWSGLIESRERSDAPRGNSGGSRSNYGTSGYGANAKHTAPQDDDSDIPFISQADTVRAWLS